MKKFLISLFAIIIIGIGLTGLASCADSSGNPGENGGTVQDSISNSEEDASQADGSEESSKDTTDSTDGSDSTDNSGSNWSPVVPFD